MVIFNSYVKLPEGMAILIHPHQRSGVSFDVSNEVGVGTDQSDFYISYYASAHPHVSGIATTLFRWA